MLPDRVSNPGPLTYESGVLPIALRGPAQSRANHQLLQPCTVRTACKSWLVIFLRRFLLQ